MLKRLCRVALLLIALAVTGAPLGLAPAVSQMQVESRDCVVYVTRTGERYHIDGCRYLRQSRIPLSRSDARSRGYTPCRVCGGSSC